MSLRFLLFVANTIFVLLDCTTATASVVVAVVPTVVSTKTHVVFEVTPVSYLGNCSSFSVNPFPISLLASERLACCFSGF
jgi:hypothetical protein